MPLPNRNQLVWVDMPALDLDRAITFYSAILGEQVEKVNIEGNSLGLFPCVNTHVSGCIMPSTPENISPVGPLIYFNVDGRLNNAIAAVHNHGGKILEEKTSLGPHGFRIMVLDSEGNRIALHSNHDD